MTPYERLARLASPQPLLTANDKTVSSSEFIHRVDEVAKFLNSQDVPKESFILIDNENPIDFYTLVLALWKNQNRVIFPNSAWFSHRQPVPAVTHIVSSVTDPVLQQVNNGNTDFNRNIIGDSIIFSSGSTGSPKGIVHFNNHFIDNALATKMLIDEEDCTSLTYLKPYVISAFSHFLVHFLSNSHLIFDDFKNIGKIKIYANQFHDLSIVGSPIHVLSASKSLESLNHKPRFLFSSGDFLYPNIIKRIMKSFPRSTLYKVYGMAELAGRFFVQKITSETPEEEWGYAGINIPGTKYELIDEELSVQSSFKMTGYVKNNSFEASKESHKTGDLATLINGNISLTGRSSDEIKIGANKVSLKMIEQKASSIFPLDLVVIFTMKHHIFGNLIAMAIKSETEYRRSELINKLRKVLDSGELPHQYYYLNDLPYTSTMKIDRKLLSKDTSLLRAIND